MLSALCVAIFKLAAIKILDVDETLIPHDTNSVILLAREH